MSTESRRLLHRVRRALAPYAVALWQDALVAAVAAVLIAVLVTLEACTPRVQPAPVGTPAAASGQPERVIHVVLRKSGYTPNEITVRKGESVVLELEAVDHDHGFKLDAFGIQRDVDQGHVVRVRIVPTKVGSFEFHCDVYCGDFHDDMVGTLIVQKA